VGKGFQEEEWPSSIEGNIGIYSNILKLCKLLHLSVQYDIREASQEIRDSYKMYYKLKTSFLEETLNDVLSEDGFDVLEMSQASDLGVSMLDQDLSLNGGPQLPLDISALVEPQSVANLQELTPPAAGSFSNLQDLPNRQVLTNLVNRDENHVIRKFEAVEELPGIFQAAYTAGVVLPTPVATCRYWHRSLNPKKLVDVRFSHLARNMTMQRTMKLYKLPDQPKTKGYRRITAKDMDKAHKLLEDYLKRFQLSPVFSKEEFRHWFTPKEGIIDCFVVADEKGNITDLTSYYCLPSSVMHHPVHKTVRAAYSFYNVSTKTPWLDLMNDALISARNVQMDVYNALDLMENKKYFAPLKFGAGDGNLQYYLYNWRCPSMQPEEIALILM